MADCFAAADTPSAAFSLPELIPAAAVSTSLEIVGNGAGAGISDLYYPESERTWTKTGQKWLTQVAIDGVFNVFKEFWPDIDKTVFRGRY
jgi:hypothetical protein